MRTAAAWSFPCGGCFLWAGGGPHELRLPIFLRPLGGALKNRSAAPASPPCFRRRRTGCGTQHPLRLACVSLAAAPTTPRCFRRRRRSSSLQSAPLLFESTLAALYKLPDKTETPVSIQHWSSWWARVDYASRAAKNSLAGCFCPEGRKAPGRSCSHPPAYVSLTFAQKKTASVSLHQRFFHGRGWITQAAHLKRPRRGLFAAGTYSGGPYELRLPIFLQPLGGALKNRSAAPASPPCFRRRRWSAPLLFESTRLCKSDVCAKENRQCISTLAVFSWARVDSNHRS